MAENLCDLIHAGTDIRYNCDVMCIIRDAAGRVFIARAVSICITYVCHACVHVAMMTVGSGNKTRQEVSG